MKVRFAPSPTGSLHIGNALGAVANRNFAPTMLLRIDDTDPARNLPGGEQAIIDDLSWLGIGWDEGPVRQSERQERYREAAAALPARFQGVTLLRDDGTATYHLASVVDDLDFEITHVLARQRSSAQRELATTRSRSRSAARRPNTSTTDSCSARTARSSRSAHRAPSIASLREEGIPAEAVTRLSGRARHPKARRPVSTSRGSARSPWMRSQPRTRRGPRRAARASRTSFLRSAAHTTCVEAGEIAQSITNRPEVTLPEEAATLELLRGLRLERPELLDATQARELVSELKSDGGHLRAVRLALTGRDHGPELWSAAHGATPMRTDRPARCGSLTPSRGSLAELPPRPGPGAHVRLRPTVYARAHVGNARPFISACGCAHGFARAATR